jgi:hypothetical protein
VSQLNYALVAERCSYLSRASRSTAPRAAPAPAVGADGRPARIIIASQNCFRHHVLSLPSGYRPGRQYLVNCYPGQSRLLTVQSATCVSLVNSKSIARFKVPLESARRDIEVLRLTSGAALSQPAVTSSEPVLLEERRVRWLYRSHLCPRVKALLESPVFGNAIYVINSDWKRWPRMTKQELLAHR